jgi:hypothetical protein
VFAVVFLSKIALVSFENAPVSILVGLIAHLAIAPFFALGTQISKELNNWKADLFVLIFLGAFRGIVIVFCARFFDLPTVVSDQFRVFNSALAFPTWFIFFTVAIEARYQYQREFNLLFQQTARGNDKSEFSRDPAIKEAISAEEIIGRVQSLTSKLGTEIQSVLKRSAVKADYTYESNQIQDLIQKELRPASRELWQGKFISSPQILKFDLLRIVLLQQRLPIALVLFGSAPFLFVGITGAYGLEVAIIQTSAATLPVFLSYLVLENLNKLRVMTRSQSNFLALGMGLIAPALVQYFLIPASLRLTTNFLSFLLFQFALWLVLVGLLIGYNLVYSLNQQRRAVLASFETLLKDDKYLELMNTKSSPLDSMEMSRYLHGEIQTGLTASILLLQQASRNGDAVLAREALEGAVKILMRDHLEAFEQKLIPSEVHLAQIVSGWRGIADVSIDLEFVELLDEATARDTVELIAEGVANAIRHGKATQITVTDKEEQGEIRVFLISNSQESPDGELGLGTQMFNRLTTSWSFERQNGQGLLTFTLPK